MASWRSNRKRHQNGPRPRRNFVNIEPEPVGKQHDLRRNRRNRVIVILPEETKIDLGKCIDFGDAAHLQNLLAGALHRRMIRRISRQLQPKISLHRSADVRRPGRINAPSAIFILMAQNPVGRLLKTSPDSRSPAACAAKYNPTRASYRLRVPRTSSLLHAAAKKKLARRRDRRAHAAAQILQFFRSEGGDRTQSCGS